MTYGTPEKQERWQTVHREKMKIPLRFDPVEWITNTQTRRKSYGVSQSEYTETAGINRSYYSVLLTGKKRATKSLLEHLKWFLRYLIRIKKWKFYLTMFGSGLQPPDERQ